jgi:hypothetical protein
LSWPTEHLLHGEKDKFIEEEGEEKGDTVVKAILYLYFSQPSIHILLGLLP